MDLLAWKKAGSAPRLMKVPRALLADRLWVRITHGAYIGNGWHPLVLTAALVLT